jgi:PII-like signaling protein
VNALALSVHFGERDRAGGRFLADALLDLIGSRGLAAGVLLRGSAGFGARHHLHTDRVLTLSEDLPLVAVAVDTEPRIRAALPAVRALAGDGLVTLERAQLGVEELAGTGDAKLTVYAARGLPYREAVAALRRHGVAGATVLAGVDGTLAGERRRGRLFGRNAGVPVMLVSVGPTGALRAALPDVQALLPGSIATLERVRVCKRDGNRLAAPHTPEEAGERWLRVTLYGHAHGEEALLRLRRTAARGATVLHGSWGYHGAHAPHGDRLLALRRDLPVVVLTIDAPERAARHAALLDELTGDSGLLTSELVPAWRATGGGFEHGDLMLGPP